jgi:hypothetical protein
MTQTTLSRSERAPLVTDAIPPPLRRRGITQRQLFVTMLVGATMLALFGSHDTPVWTERLGDNGFAHRVHDAVIEWNTAVARIGLGYPHAQLREGMQHFLDWQWGADNR